MPSPQHVPPGAPAVVRRSVSELIPVPYCHTVFTLPHQLNPWIRANPKPLPGMLFSAVAEVLQAFAHDPAWRLEGQLGFLAMLHTWNQRMLHHVHLHCVVPAGVLDAQGRFRIGRSRYLFKNASLAKAFRHAYCRRLEQAPASEGWCEPRAEPFLPWCTLVCRLRDLPWNTYSKPPFAGPAQMLEYPGRYTHRVAISNHRIQAIEDGQVTFTCRDRADGKRPKTKTLPAEEFIRRFLLHILLPGFRKIRYFGWMAPCNKNQAIEQIRDQLVVSPPPCPTPETLEETMLRLTGEPIFRCPPRCRQGRLHLHRILDPRARAPPTAPPTIPAT